MCAAQLDELPATNDTPEPKSGGGGLMPALIAIILAPLLSAGVMIIFFKLNEKPAQASSTTGDSQPLNMESAGDLQYFELTGLITNLGGPIKSRYINVELKLEGLAGDFEKVLELNEHRIRDKALQIMGGYSYEDAQLDGFQERVRVDLKKGFSVILKEYRSGESDIIRHIYFTQFVVQ
jgi:flagellar basal body-associated protein FliL|tara:strand:- start:2562 stop:3098 length:537 start_codon:yes stop_codon:yes gene_type:complete